MSYRTLVDLDADIRYRYDLLGFESRHPQANVYALINDAYRTLRDRLTSDGSLVFISSTEGSQTTTGRTSGYPGTLLSSQIFGTFTIVHEVHVQVGVSWVPLAHRSLADALTHTDNSTTGCPNAWALAGVSAESGAYDRQGLQVLIIPSLDQVRTFRVLGLKSWTDLTSHTDRILTDMGFHEFIMAYVGLAIANRDDDVQLYEKRFIEVERVYQDLKLRAKRRDPAPTRRIDVRSRRRVY